MTPIDWLVAITLALTVSLVIQVPFFVIEQIRHRRAMTRMRAEHEARKQRQREQFEKILADLERRR